MAPGGHRDRPGRREHRAAAMSAGRDPQGPDGQPGTPRAPSCMAEGDPRRHRRSPRRRAGDAHRPTIATELFIRRIPALGQDAKVLLLAQLAAGRELDGLPGLAEDVPLSGSPGNRLANTWRTTLEPIAT
ncbi:MAG: hypothetical protein MZU79_07315 [Anaerotruncus sp.]|nr:hypothetical protein [Anaerotruncus sp.]